MPFLAGCTGSSLATASGMVLLDGQPVADAFVEFIPVSAAAGTSLAYGKTDASGKFAMEFSRNARGVMPGEYRVSIRTADLAQDASGAVHMLKERIPDNYNNRGTSELTATVVAGEHNEFEFNLSTNGRITQPKMTRGL